MLATCRFCGAVWVARSPTPARCPRCRKRHPLAADAEPVPLSRPQCNRCGYRWTARTPSPTSCPACGSKLWNTPPRIFRLTPAAKAKPRNAPRVRRPSR